MARRLDARLDVPEELYAVCKTASPDIACEGIDGAVQLLGGRGYLEPDELPRMLRDARVFRIGEGPTEALHLFLGARVAHNRDLLGFLEGELGAADAAASIEEAAQVLGARKATPPGLRYALLGELATAATLFAVTRKDALERPSPARTLAAAWTEARFQSRRAAILNERARAADGLTAREVAEWITDAAEAIGDVDAGGPAAVWEMDPWIRAGETKATRARATPDEAPGADTGPTDDRVRRVARAWLAERLAIPVSSITDDVPLAQLGLDSVLAIELAHALEQALGRPVDPGAAWAFPTLTALARGLGTSAAAAPPRIALERRPDADPAPVWFAERELYELMAADPRQEPYNLFIPLRLAVPPDPARIARAFALLVERHESLRTSFVVIDGKLVRRVARTIAAPIAVETRRGLSPSEEAEAIHAVCHAVRHHRFDPGCAPLFTGTLLDLGDHGFLALSFNHLIVDAWALGLLHRELADLWNALGRDEVPALAPLPIRPSDYAAAAGEALHHLIERGAAAYPPWPEGGYRLPLDAPMPRSPSVEGAVHRMVIEADLWSRARATAAAVDLPSGAAMLVAFQVALHRHARRPDVAFSVVRGNRREPELRPMVGLCAYHETFESTLREGDTWADLLERTRSVVVDQRLDRMPHEVLVRPPTRRVIFNFHNFEATAGAPTAPFAYALDWVRWVYLWSTHDILLQAFSVAGGLRIATLYRPEVLRAETLDALGHGMEEALEALAADPFAPVA